MTMQIGIRAADDSIVVAGDCRYVLSEPGSADAMSNASKIVLNQKHGIAIAIAGRGDPDINPAKELDRELSSVDTIREAHPDDGGLEQKLLDWGNAFFRQHRQEQHDLENPLCRLLVVNPKTYYRFVRLYVNFVSFTRHDTNCMVNGHESNPAIFWPQYTRGHDHELTLAQATGVAATTILMGCAIEPRTISGLEICQYDGAAWKRFTEQHTAKIKSRFASFSDATKQAVFLMSMA
jgi:hypothetical protein